MLTIEDKPCERCHEGLAECGDAECFECQHRAAKAAKFEFVDEFEVFDCTGGSLATIEQESGHLLVNLNPEFLNPDRLELDPRLHWWVKFERMAADDVDSACRTTRYSTTLWSRPDVDISEATFGVGWDILNRQNEYLGRVARECVAVAYGSSSRKEGAASVPKANIVWRSDDNPYLWVGVDQGTGNELRLHRPAGRTWLLTAGVLGDDCRNAGETYEVVHAQEIAENLYALALALQGCQSQLEWRAYCDTEHGPHYYYLNADVPGGARVGCYQHRAGRIDVHLVFRGEKLGVEEPDREKTVDAATLVEAVPLAERLVDEWMARRAMEKQSAREEELGP